MSDSRHRPAKVKATIICSRNGKVLLVRRKGTKWKFPSGGLVAGEAPIVTAARELSAELSLLCPGLHACGTVEVGNILHHLFMTEITDDCRIVPGKRIEDCRWIEWDELSPSMLKPTSAALLSRDLAGLVGFDESTAQQPT